MQVDSVCIVHVADNSVAVQKSSQLLIEDEEGPREVVKMLHSIHRKVLEAIILDIVG